MGRRTARISQALGAAALLLSQLCSTPVAQAQAIDCNRLAAQIAAASPRAGGGGGQYAAAAGKQRAELARMQGYANSLGCDRPDFFLFGNRSPQCGGINAQISRMQANLQGLTQAAAYGGDGARAALQQRFDTYCRGAGGYGTATNFFDQLFGGARRPVEETPQIMVPPEEEQQAGSGARGGSQALCVRSCDGGYFPMSVAASRRDLGDLQELCSALCPGTEAKLFTRVPGREIGTAVSADGNAYADLPNALKFEKTFDKSCTCKPADKSWVQALADAERLLGENRRGDIVVTPERAEELSRLAGPAGGRERPSRKDAKTAKAGGPTPVEETAAPAEKPADATGALRGSDVKPRMRVISQ